ncbi:hypothetical protein LTR70_010685 [Exophiala xenobiotica]|uniref:Uncharacterized protein n=1 Tax=Lithohypha guttulata TaxID=1690604 RepID=A0ABR0JT74_9EURO|nr:hypothetical protein LTR24_010672 [Lithohypha guttulata]KAK5309000.1 hypothetical protein LTR70_010685 [Exophiala xenobiotica]
MQVPQPEIASSEQRLLQLKFAVQGVRVHKIRAYLQALEKGLEELESAIWTIGKMTRSSGHETDTMTPAASSHPNAVVLSSTTPELPPRTISGAVSDPISHSLICKQLPHQLALLSTLESSATCFCGLPLFGSAARDRNGSVSLVVPPKSPHLESVGSSHACGADHDEDICQPVDGLLPEFAPNHFENYTNTFLNACDKGKSAESQIQQKDELPQPELYDKEALKQLGGANVSPVYGEMYGDVPLDAISTVFASLQPHVSFTGTANNSSSSMDAKVDGQKREERSDNNAEHAGSISSYTSDDSDADSFTMMQQQQGLEATAEPAPAPAKLRSRARGASDVFARSHVLHEHSMDESVLLQANNCFAARMARQRLLNERLYTQGVIPGLPWSLEESKRISLWNQLHRNSPTRASSTLKGLSWTRGVHKVGYDPAGRRDRDHALQSRDNDNDDNAKERPDSDPEDSLGRVVASISEKRDTLVYRGAALPPDVAGEIADTQEGMQLEGNNGRSG